MIASGLLVLLVHPLIPVWSLGDLLALACSRPGEIHYASTGVGSNIHLTASCGSWQKIMPDQKPGIPVPVNVEVARHQPGLRTGGVHA